KVEAELVMARHLVLADEWRKADLDGDARARRALERPVPAAMPALSEGLGARRKRLRLKGADNDINLLGRSHADPRTPFAHRPILEALIGGKSPVMTADRQGHEIAVEGRRVKIGAGCKTAEGDIDAVVEELFLAIEPDELRTDIEA